MESWTLNEVDISMLKLVVNATAARPFARERTQHFDTNSAARFKSRSSPGEQARAKAGRKAST